MREVCGRICGRFAGSVRDLRERYAEGVREVCGRVELCGRCAEGMGELCGVAQGARKGGGVRADVREVCGRVHRREL